MTAERQHRPNLDPADQEIEAPPDPDEAERLAAERFAAALNRDAAESGRPDDADTLTQLRTSAIAAMGRVVYSSNAVFVVELEAPDPGDPERAMRAIYKPARGERPLWDFARGSLHLREAAAYQLDAALGTNVVPPTTLRDGPHGPGSVQLFVDEPDRAPTESEAEVGLHALATFDVIANNADRKRAHVLAGPGGRLWGIDNALTFLPYPRQRTVLISLGGDPLPEPQAAQVQELAADDERMDGLAETLSRLLDPGEVGAAQARIRELAAAPWYPILDPWDGRPWDGW